MKKVAAGLASAACRYETPSVTIPSAGSPSATTFRPEVSPKAAISSSFARRRRWAGRANAGTITRPGMSRSKKGARGAAAAGRRRTSDFEWQTRVVIRKSTGSFQRSEISSALKKKS